MAAAAGNQEMGGNIFRAETMVTDVDLRLDVAARMLRVADSEDIEVDERDVRVFGNMANIRGGREIVVDGDYARKVVQSNMTMLNKGYVKEEVRGATREQFSVESEAIMAGGFVAFNAGPCQRMLAMSDQLCWGGWVEVDGTRVDIAKFAFRTFIAYNHNVGIRMTRGHNYIDDYSIRRERFGTLRDEQKRSVHSGMPGSDLKQET